MGAEALRAVCSRERRARSRLPAAKRSAEHLSETDGAIEALEADIQTLDVLILQNMDDSEKVAELQRERVAKSEELSRQVASRSVAEAKVRLLPPRSRPFPPRLCKSTGPPRQFLPGSGSGCRAQFHFQQGRHGALEVHFSGNCAEGYRRQCSVPSGRAPGIQDLGPRMIAAIIGTCG